jgi:hypothetical protein
VPDAAGQIFGAKLRDVFAKRFPCASHQPAAFCLVPLNVTSSRQSLYFASINDIIDAGERLCQRKNKNFEYKKQDFSQSQVEND